MVNVKHILGIYIYIQMFKRRLRMISEVKKEINAGDGEGKSASEMEERQEGKNKQLRRQRKHKHWKLFID